MKYYRTKLIYYISVDRLNFSVTLLIYSYIELLQLLSDLSVIKL